MAHPKRGQRPCHSRPSTFRGNGGYSSLLVVPNPRATRLPSDGGASSRDLESGAAFFLGAACHSPCGADNVRKTATSTIPDLEALLRWVDARRRRRCARIAVTQIRLRAYARRIVGGDQ